MTQSEDLVGKLWENKEGVDQGNHIDPVLERLFTADYEHPCVLVKFEEAEIEW